MAKTFRYFIGVLCNIQRKTSCRTKLTELNLEFDQQNINLLARRDCWKAPLKHMGGNFVSCVNPRLVEFPQTVSIQKQEILYRKECWFWREGGIPTYRQPETFLFHWKQEKTCFSSDLFPINTHFEKLCPCQKGLGENPDLADTTPLSSLVFLLSSVYITPPIMTGGSMSW